MMSVNVGFRFNIIYVETEVIKRISFYIYCYKLLTVLIGNRNLVIAKTIKSDSKIGFENMSDIELCTGKSGEMKSNPKSNREFMIGADAKLRL